jgi:FtsH-binding integral membrane protein
MFDYATSTGTIRSASAINSAMGRVYGHMMLAVLTSMCVSFLVSTSPAMMAFFFTGAMKWVTIFAPLVAILALGFGLERMSKNTLQLCLYGFSALMGLSFATIFVIYAMGSIVSAFMGAAILFAVLSGYGYFTKKDLDSGSSVLQMVISAIAIIVFLGLTAYDTQKIRQAVTYESDGKMEVWGALTLYLDFINLFLSLLQLFGGRRD